MFGFWKKAEKKIEEKMTKPCLSVVIREVKQQLVFGGFVLKTYVDIENINSVRIDRMKEFFETFEAGLYMQIFNKPNRDVETMLHTIIENLYENKASKIQTIVDFLNGKINHPEPETTHTLKYT